MPTHRDRGSHRRGVDFGAAPQHRFFSHAKLNVAIRTLVDQLNARLMRQLSASRRELFDTIDRPVLMPLPAAPYQYAEWRRTRMAPAHHIEVACRFYSVPPGLIRHVVEVRITEATVEVFHRGTRVASHPRFAVRHRHATTPTTSPVMGSYPHKSS